MKSALSTALFLLLVTFTANAQTWNNLVFDADQDSIEYNPLKGFVDLFTPSNTFPRSIEAKLFGLDEVMIGIDNFNWTPIDDFIAAEALDGDHVYIQVNIDPADGTTDMPAFLLPLVDFEDFPGNANHSADLCPDWNDPDLMGAMLNFIDSLGERYNDDQRVFLVHLGLYGMWGEWHIGGVPDVRPDFEMTPANKALIANRYATAFPDKLLLARYPENMPNPEAYGYSDGLFFTESISGPLFNHGFFQNALSLYNADENWKLHPVGGEIAPAVQPTMWLNSPNTTGQNVADCFDAIRPTWLFSHHIFTALTTGAEWDNALAAHKAMGYTLHIDKYRLTAEAGLPAIEVNIQNKGLAPLYANWDVEFAVLDAGGTLTSFGTTKLDLNLIQPDVLDNYRSFVPSVFLADGTYKFLMRVLNPMKTHSHKAKAVRFANTTQDADENEWITLDEVLIDEGGIGTALKPVKATGVAISQSTATMVVGNTLQLAGTVSPPTATNQDLTWVSNHPGTASVSATGMVTAGESYGTATVSAYTQDGGLFATCDITVDPLRANIPALIQAEDYIKMNGIALEGHGNGITLGFIETRDWMEYGVISATGGDFYIQTSSSSPGGGGEISVLNTNNDTIAVIKTPKSRQGGWGEYKDTTSTIFSLPAGLSDLRLYAKSGGFNLDSLAFVSAAPLPVSLVEFTASPEGDQISLEWATASELNNEGFYLERGTSPSDFSNIAWVNGKGTSTLTQQYGYTDKDVEYKTDYYYRLVQQDLDGKQTYSDIVNVKLTSNKSDASGSLRVFPNPTSSSITLSVNGGLDESLRVFNIVDITGAIVSQPAIDGNTIDLSHLPTGTYYLQAEIQGEQIVKRIIKN
ncbi:MAG: carbohydrate-binding protein [Saprospiraceae bacterium]